MNQFHFKFTNHTMLFPKAFYFLAYAAVASLGPFLALYYEQSGLTGRQIGVLTGIFPLIMLISSPLFGAVADASQRHGHILKLAVGGTIAAVFLLRLAHSFVGLLLIVILFAFFFAPIMPLIDKTVLDLLGRRKSDYGRQRLWGSIGWGLAAPTVGWLAERQGLQWPFYAFLVLMSLALLTTFGLSARPVSLGGPVWRGLGLLLTDWRWISFLVIIFTAGMGLSIIHNYLFLYLAGLGASKTLMGFALTIATVGELTVMFFSAWLLRAWGTKGLLMLSAGVLALRLLAYAFIQSPWLVLLVQLLHGPTFAAMWMASVSRADEIAPAGLGATAQGVHSSVSMGLGSACGAFLGGLLYEWHGPALMFQWAGLAVLVGLVVFVVMERSLNRPNPAAEVGL